MFNSLPQVLLRTNQLRRRRADHGFREMPCRRETHQGRCSLQRWVLMKVGATNNGIEVAQLK